MANEEIGAGPGSSRFLKGKFAVVTGGGRGLGRGIAMALCEQGACVMLTGRDRGVLEATAAKIRKTADWRVDFTVATAGVRSDAERTVKERWDDGSAFEACCHLARSAMSKATSCKRVLSNLARIGFTGSNADLAKSGRSHFWSRHHQELRRLTTVR